MSTFSLIWTNGPQFAFDLTAQSDGETLRILLPARKQVANSIGIFSLKMIYISFKWNVLFRVLLH